MIQKAYFLPIVAAFCIFAVTATIFIYSKLKNKKISSNSCSSTVPNPQMLEDIKKIEKILYEGQG